MLSLLNSDKTLVVVVVAIAAASVGALTMPVSAAVLPNSAAPAAATNSLVSVDADVVSASAERSLMTLTAEAATGGGTYSTSAASLWTRGRRTAPNPRHTGRRSCRSVHNPMRAPMT